VTIAATEQRQRDQRFRLTVDVPAHITRRVVAVTAAVAAIFLAVPANSIATVAQLPTWPADPNWQSSCPLRPATTCGRSASSAPTVR
jgi:hypothetical protein